MTKNRESTHQLYHEWFGSTCDAGCPFANAEPALLRALREVDPEDPLVRHVNALMAKLMEVSEKAKKAEAELHPLKDALAKTVGMAAWKDFRAAETKVQVAIPDHLWTIMTPSEVLTDAFKRIAAEAAKSLGPGRL